MRSEAERRGDALNQLGKLGRCSIPHACVLMGIHHHTLRGYVDDGLVETILIGKRHWISKEEIDRYLKEGKRTPNPLPSDEKATIHYGEGEVNDDISFSTFSD